MHLYHGSDPAELAVRDALGFLGQIISWPECWGRGGPGPPHVHPFHQPGGGLGAKSSRVAVTFSLSSRPASVLGEQEPLEVDLLPK